MKAWPVLGISMVVSLLGLAHWLLWSTWVDWVGMPAGWMAVAAKVALGGLAVSFPVAALAGFRFTGPAVRALYGLASVWLGALNYLFWAAVLCRLIGVAAWAGGLELNRPRVAETLLGAAVAVCLYGLANAYWVRTVRVTVRLAGLPEAWMGRTALVMSDLHLGHLNREGFSRRMARRARALKPDAIFLPGDLFDGPHEDAERLAAPLLELRPPQGFYYTAGNHDEYGPMNHYAEVLRRGGVRVLENERVTVDGLHIVGVPYGDASFPMRLKTTLEGLGIVPGEAAVLLNHVPNRLPIAEQAGIGLQVSGHTHGGQIFPFTWVTRRAFGKYTVGLERFGRMQVLTSYGAGTWGPPMRVGTRSEVVLMRFERE